MAYCTGNNSAPSEKQKLRDLQWVAMFSRRFIDVHCWMSLPIADQRSNLFQIAAKGSLKHLPDGIYRITTEGVFELQEVSGWQRVSISGKTVLTQSWPNNEELGMVAGYRRIELPIRLMNGQVADL
jgi:hypothetical protein